MKSYHRAMLNVLLAPLAVGLTACTSAPDAGYIQADRNNWNDMQPVIARDVATGHADDQDINYAWDKRLRSAEAARGLPSPATQPSVAPLGG